MNTRIIVVGLSVALALIAAAVLPYVLTFGFRPIENRGAWGEFGDYFAGLLNPLFSLLAFFALLYSIVLQRAEQREAAARFAAQHEVAKRELAAYANERTTSELLAVVRDIDDRLNRILNTSVSQPGTHPQITVAMMVSEASRIRQHGGESASYANFVALAKEPGSVVEALARDMTSLIEQMREVLATFSETRGTSQAPLIVYYANKACSLLPVLEDAGLLPPYTRASLASVGDKHH